MRIRGRHQQPPLVSRRDAQSRLVRLVIGLVMVFVAIKVAADPATWVILFPGESDRATATPGLEDVSYHVRLDGNDDLKPDEFRSAPSAEGPAAGANSRSEPEEERSETRPATIVPATFADIQDDTLGFRGQEFDQYIEILAALRDGATLPEVDPAATFPVVMIEPEHFRGQAIEVEGLARRILKISAGKNDAGFKDLYELWVFTPDSGNNPWRVVVTELPPSMPQQELIENGIPVRLVGLFFKRQGYETREHSLHVAPLLLARTVEPVSRPSRQIAEFDVRPWVIGTVAVALVGLGLWLWQFRREDRAFERTTLNRFTSEQEGEVEARPEQETISPDEYFRRLTAEANESEPGPTREPPAPAGPQT